MKRNYLLATISLLAAALLVGGCSQEETTVTDGTTLPEGMYPLTFTAVQTGDGLATRVEDDPDGMSSQWNDGDKIEVIVSKDDEEKTTTCTLTADGAVSQYDPQLYWQTKEKYTINAWYSNITEQSTGVENTVSLDNQSSGLAYVLKVEEGFTASYDDENISLPFKHQLAKVRVKLEGDKALDVNTVRVKGYTSCTVEKGVVKNSGNTQDYISMYQNGGYWEANLVPMADINADDFIKLNGNVQAKVTNVSELKAGNVYEIIINVKQATLKPVDGKFTVNRDDNVLIKNYKGDAFIEVNGTATITLDNVQLTTPGTAMTVNNGATVTLNVKGMDNSLFSTNGSGIGAHENCNIVIKGNGTGNSKLTVSSGEGRNVGIGFITNSDQGTYNYGNIEISDVSLSVTASAGGGGYEAGAAIGVTASVWGYDSRIVCGNITINNSNVTANSKGGAAGIGTSFWYNTVQSLTISTISITGSTVTATSKENKWNDNPACIGMGVVEISSGGVTIQKIEIEKSTLNLTTNAQYKVGKGAVPAGSATITNGIIVNGQNKGNEGWNP